MAKYGNFGVFTNKREFTSENLTLNDIQKMPFLFLQEHKKGYFDMAKTAMQGTQTDSELGKIFFSRENVTRIQRKLKKEVFMRTKGEFRLDANQEDSDLLVSMRAVYFQYGRFMPTQIIHQVKELNQQVIDYIIPDVITAIKQEYAYLKEINEPIKPIARPMNVNNGKVILPSFTTTWEI